MDLEAQESKYDYINPSHYKKFSLEVIDMMIKIYGKEKVADYCEINAFKYKLRMGNKPNQPLDRDMDKANWYLQKANELRNGLLTESKLEDILDHTGMD